MAASKVLLGPEAAGSRATGRPSSRTSGRRSTPRRSSPTPRASRSCARRRRSTAGTSTTAGIALIWRGGCIIRSVFLGKIKEAFDANPDLPNLLLDPFFRDKVVSQPGGLAARRLDRHPEGVPVPAFATALTYFDGFRAERLPGEPAAGPARLLRRPHLRAHGPAARQVLPHELDRPRRHHLRLDLHGVDEPGARRRDAPARRRRTRMVTRRRFLEKGALVATAASLARPCVGRVARGRRPERPGPGGLHRRRQPRRPAPRRLRRPARRRDRGPLRRLRAVPPARRRRRSTRDTGRWVASPG